MTQKMRIGPLNPRLSAAGARFFHGIISRLYSHWHIHGPDSNFAQERLQALREKLARGQRVYIAGVASNIHNSGIALLEVSRDGGIRIICNNEEERFSGKKHCLDFPGQGIGALLDEMKIMGIAPDQIDTFLGTWDYAKYAAILIQSLLEELPFSLKLLWGDANPVVDIRELFKLRLAPRKLRRKLGFSAPAPILSMHHHENHAWFSHAISPFAKDDEPTLISVIDGTGDSGSASLYLAEGGNIARLKSNESVHDSLGFFYSVVSSTQGGWTVLSSEGRYMGAAAYGNQDRLTNPFYMMLRQLFYFDPDGDVHLNRSLANWHRTIAKEPYSPDLTRILGQPIAQKDLWNPDAVLRAEDLGHKEDTQDRLDRAAATQLLFEDALFHFIGHAIRRTGASRLVLTGGTALNAIGNMRLMEHFNEGFYQRQLGKKACLHVWVPPTPGDAGVTMGAAYQFARLAGVEDIAPFRHAFLCGAAPTKVQIQSALDDAADMSWLGLGDVSTASGRDSIADLMAFLTARDCVMALVQGAAETGPRALGHRSILANPCNPMTRQLLNERVKFREAIRPLAPMMTREAAALWFELQPGAADDDYNAYNYMTITARAKPAALERIPAVIHVDGTGRLQIVRAEADPLNHAYLKALGRRIGVEVAVNTSFNVAGPIVQTPRQALETLRRSGGIDVVIMVAEEGPVFVVWRKNAKPDPTGANRFQSALAAWRSLAVPVRAGAEA
jgi:carbamoyltransferase